MLKAMASGLNRAARQFGLNVSLYPEEGQNSSKSAGWWLENPEIVFDKLILKKDVDTLPFIAERELDDPHRVAVAVITPRLPEGEWEIIVPAVISSVGRDNYLMSNNHKARLEVQLGIGRPFTHKELKRVCKALILFGHYISPGYPWVENRKKNHYMKSNRDSWLFQEMTAHEILTVIDETVDIPHLQWAMNTPIDAEFPPDPHYWYNLTLATSEHNPVIEFRCGYGVMLGETALEWISELKRVLVMALATPDSYFDHWAGKKNKYMEFLMVRQRPDDEWSPLGVSFSSPI
jgi:hypothetical protein